MIGNDKFQNDFSVFRVLRELFEALTFSGEYWRLDTVSQGLFGNQSYWTVEYIMAYVALTAAFYLLSGVTRVIVILAFMALAGPTVVLLSPLWIAGCICFEFHRRCYDSWVIENSDRPQDAKKVWPIVRAWAPVYGAFGLALVIFFEVTGVGQTAYQESKSLSLIHI